MKTKVVILSAAAVISLEVFAVDVGDTYAKQNISESTTFTASTTKQTAYPSGLPTPIFWFDATRTNGWEIAAGTRTVTKIPSLVGDRYLTTDHTTGHFTAWEITGATYVDSDEELCGGPSIDFGEVHYGANKSPGLVFNGYSPEEGCSASNMLYNIGSIVAVYGSHNSGGYILGGGVNSYTCLRGDDSASATSSTLTYANLLGKNPGSKAFYDGVVWQDGLPNYVKNTGLSGAWQTLVINATADSTLTATGIGLNDSRVKYYSSYAHGGGMKIAELILFSEKLTDNQRAQIDAWLRTKWFGTGPRGWNGNAAISRIHAFSNSGASSEGLARIGFSVAEGETLTVGVIDGGQAAAETPGIDKTGEGTLAIDDMTEYDGDFRLKGGTLAFNRRAVPSALPERRLAHFDASDASSLTTFEENGTNFVTAWKGDSSSLYKGERLSLVTASGCANAFVRPDVFGAGLPAIDLGPFGTASGAFSFTTNASTSTTVGFNNIMTIVAVVGAQESGGHLANSYFVRSVDLPQWDNSLVATGSKAGWLYLTTGICFIDGVKRDMTAGYAHPGYQVIALQIPGSNVSTIGRKDANATTFSGGLRISEMAIYNRALTEQELRDASAYLMDKWFGRAAPGYARVDGGRAPDMRDLSVHCAGTAIDVPSNATVRINGLDASQPFVKTGDGTLQLQSVRDAGDTVVVKGGKVTAGYDADPQSATEMAPEPAFHLDASATNRMDLVMDGGTNYVAYWYDETMRNYALQADEAYRPYLRTDVEGMVNGRPVIDFGEASTSGRYMYFCRGVSGIRAVYVVVGEMQAKTSLLGTYKNCPDGDSSISTMYNFARETQHGYLFMNYSTNPQVWGGTIMTNGVKGEYSTKPTADWQIIEVHTTAGAYASALTGDRIAHLAPTRGGQRIAEVLLYTRPLSARERVATRNYLRAKWLPAQTAEDLPDDTEAVVSRAGNVVNRVAALVASNDMTVAAADDIVAKEISGSADVAKTGSGTLTVGDLSGYSGTISVQEGTLALAGSDPVDATAGVVESGRIFHADAMYGIQCETNELGAISVTNWISRHDSSWSAVPGVQGCNPTLRAYGTGGNMFAVDMAFGKQQCFRFCKNGEFEHVNPIRSVFWVVGSQNGGGILLGGGTNYNVSAQHYNFHRGYPKTGTFAVTNLANATLPLINSSADTAVRSYTDWWLNGASISPTSTGLSGDWDQISMVFTRDTAYSDAEGFAFDGRSFDASSTMHSTLRPCIGNQRLAEVIIYDRILTDAERLQNEAYLRTKWSIGLHASALNEASVELASGAVLDCGGTNQYVAALSGAGTVQNGTLAAGALVADADATAWPAVTGTFEILDGVSVELRNLPEIAGITYVKILQSAEFSGMANIRKAVYAGDAVPVGANVRLAVREGGWLCVRINPKTGLTVNLR